jgi:hypothetical protein
VADESWWPLVRRLIGQIVGLDGYRARCQVVPHFAFDRIDDDVALDDLMELSKRCERIFGTRIPKPELAQVVQAWVVELSESLAQDGIDEAKATAVLRAHFGDQPA